MKKTETATAAIRDGLGNVIADTYSTKSNAITGLSVKDTTVTYVKGDGKTGSFMTQDTTYLPATETSNGLMSAADKTKLDQMSNATAFTKSSATTLSSNWQEDNSAVTYSYYYDVSVDKLSVNDYVEVNIEPDNLESAENFGICPVVKLYAGKFRLLAKTLPNTDLTIEYVVWKGASS